MLNDDQACYGDEGISSHRWEGYSLHEKFGWMQSGEGAGAVGHAVAWLTDLAGLYADANAELGAVMSDLKLSWEGRSAEASAAAATGLARWLGGAGESLGSRAGGSMNDYTASFAELKPRVPAPADVGAQSRLGGWLDAATGGYGALVGLQSEYSRRVEAAAALDAQANAALYAHQNATQAALFGFPRLQAPPEVAVDAAQAPGVLPSGRPTPTGAAESTALPAPRAGSGGAHEPPATHDSGGGTATASAPVGVGTAGEPVRSASEPWPGLAGGALLPTLPGPPSVQGTRTYRPPVPPRAAPPSADARSGPRPPLAERSGSGSSARPTTPHAPTRPAASPAGPHLPLAPGGAEGRERTHRNQRYLPSDEPFAVEFDDVSPPVLGARRDAPD